MICRVLVLFCFFLSSSVCFDTNPYYFDNWCGHGLQYLNDRNCDKKFPSVFDRNWRCPILYTSAEGWSPDIPLSQVVVDGSLSLPDVILSVILIRRTSTGVFYKYVSNGKHDVPYQTWSSSKIFAAANAGSFMEQTCSLSAGLTSSTQGKHGVTPLGDLISIICSYDTTKGYTSNSLARYMHDIGGRERAFQLIQNWLQVKNQSFGGNYGEPTPTDLKFSFSTSSSPCTVGPNTTGDYANTLSALTMSELVKRIVLYRDVIPEHRIPGLQWEDAQTIMYGADKSVLFPDMRWGGMTADTAIYIQSGLNMDEVDARSNGNWRIFSKLGDGYSDTRGVGETTTNSYACLPVLDKSGKPVADQGVEFVISAHSSVVGDTSLAQAEKYLQSAVAQVVTQIYSGKL